MAQESVQDMMRDSYLNLMKKTLTGAIYPESAWRLLEHSRHIRHPEKLTLARPVHYFKTRIRDFAVSTLGKRALYIIEAFPFDMKKRECGYDWPFIGYTMVGLKRLENVQECFQTVVKDNIPGDLIETGAWRGGMTIFMRALLNAYGDSARKVWVADSFEGLPVPKNKADGWDMSQVRQLKVSLEDVKSNFERFGLLDNRVEFLKGWFCDTLPAAPVEKLAILRLDGDLYHSTMDVLKNLYHKVSKGGFVIVDDYFSWEACRQAVTDFLAKEGYTVEIKEIGKRLGAYWRVN